MSYCVNCGVKLSDYHKECPLCKTSVVNPGVVNVSENNDYPEYRINKVKTGNEVRKMYTAIILSLLCFVYAIIPLLLNLIITKNVTWSLIPIISVALLWIGVAFPFFRKKNSFFVLFSINCFAVAIYLLALNLIISGNVSWAKFASVSLIIVWIIMSGIFIPEKIRKVIPLTFYFILSGILITIFFVLMLNSENSFLYLILPMNITLFVLVIASYFVITAKVYDFLGLLIVLMFDVSIFVVVLNMLISNYLTDSFSLTWSIIVIIVTIPIIAISHAVRKSGKLKNYVSKNLHR